MTDISVDFFTSLPLNKDADPLAKIWSLEHWSARVDKIRHLKIVVSTESYQRFELIFDSGRTDFDRVLVERRRQNEAIEVHHLCPPPGLLALSGRWWTDKRKTHQLFVRRTALFAPADFDLSAAHRMFGMLRDNLIKLMDSDPCSAKP